MASIVSFVAVGEMVDYCCSKASTLAFYEGLTQELRHFYAAFNVLTIVVKQIAVRQGGQIMLPRKLFIIRSLRGMPLWFQEMVRSHFSKVVFRVRAVRAGSE
ncbi:unnamed protein product [Penicillium salamii]|nr:unnamed protein product [Penicillium salamii]